MMELLQARGRISVPELARKLEVGERTVRRYATMLWEMGVPVEAEIRRYGGYRLRPGRRPQPMLFTEEEASGLALGLLVGLDNPFIVRRPVELREALERRAAEITVLAKRTEGEAST